MANILGLHFVVAVICWMMSGLAMAPSNQVRFSGPSYSPCCSVSIHFDHVWDVTGPSAVVSVNLTIHHGVGVVAFSRGTGDRIGLGTLGGCSFFSGSAISFTISTLGSIWYVTIGNHFLVEVTFTSMELSCSCW